MLPINGAIKKVHTSKQIIFFVNLLIFISARQIGNKKKNSIAINPLQRIDNPGITEKKSFLKYGNKNNAIKKSLLNIVEVILILPNLIIFI